MSQRLAAIVFAGVLAVVGVKYWDHLDRRERQEAQAKAKAEQQRKFEEDERKRKDRIAQIAKDSAENKRKDAEYAAKMDAEFRSRDTLASMRELASVADRYRDAARLAISTPRIALAQPIAAIQQLAREAKTVATSPCTAPVKQSLVIAIESTVDALLASMSHGNTEAPSARSATAIQSFQAGMAECSQNPSKS